MPICLHAARPFTFTSAPCWRARALQASEELKTHTHQQIWDAQDAKSSYAQKMHIYTGKTPGFSYGEHYWEIEFLEPPYGSSVMVGVGTVNARLHAGEQFINLIGMDTESWGLSYKGFLWHNGRSRKYTEPFYDRNTVIGVLLDRTTGTLTFYRNGENLGLAFSDLDQVGSALYPMVSSTAPETELQLGLRTSRLSSLQEHCIHTITHCLGHLGHTHLLPLPCALRFQIHTYSIRI